MKESVWGYWLITFGIAIITFMSILQNYVTINQEDYYLLKEVTQASLFDAIDYVHYNKYGELKINREVFIENFERRFANTIKNNKIYKTDFYEIYETPPKVSIRVSTSTGSFNVANSMTDLDVVNDIDAILEFNGYHIYSADFYSVYPATCTNNERDMMGYCSLSNESVLATGTTFTKAASNLIKNDLGWEIPDNKIKIIDIDFVSPMKKASEFNTYVNSYEVIYGIPYGGYIPYNSVGEDDFADHITDIRLGTSNDNQIFTYSLKYRCDESAAHSLTTSAGEHPNECLIGLKYRVKFSYTTT